MEEEKREHDQKMKKMEAEMEQVFEMKVKEKKQKLKDSEIELTRRHEERKKVIFTIPFSFSLTIGLHDRMILRLWKCKFANWKIANGHSNRKNMIGKAQTGSPSMSCAVAV